MIKRDLIDLISGNLEISKNKAELALVVVLEGIKETLAKGDSAILGDFGTFSRVERKARIGRNPKTGEAIQIQATNKIKFSPAKRFKDQVNGIK